MTIAIWCLFCITILPLLLQSLTVGLKCAKADIVSMSCFSPSPGFHEIPNQTSCIQICYGPLSLLQPLTSIQSCIDLAPLHTHTRARTFLHSQRHSSVWTCDRIVSGRHRITPGGVTYSTTVCVCVQGVCVTCRWYLVCSMCRLARVSER